MSTRHRAQRDGVDAEGFVAAYLEDEGFVVLERNWTAAGAELDLIVARRRAVRFVEVKARQQGDVSGLESIGPDKQARLRRAAEAWLSDQDYEEYAFLVALVVFEPTGWTLELLDDAF